MKERVNFSGAPHNMQGDAVQKLLEQFGGGPVRNISLHMVPTLPGVSTGDGFSGAS